MPTRYLPKGFHTANIPLSDYEVPVREIPRIRPFITIAQQAGAESRSLPRRLAEVLSAQDPSAPAWSNWDRELVERISADGHVPAELVDSLETSGHSWFDALLTGISGRTDEMVVFHHIKETVRELARGGHAILVGHGSIYTTRDLPGGLHVRLIAPLDVRVTNVARELDLPIAEARQHVLRLDRQRRTFFARFWPDRPLEPEMFAATLNIGELDETSIIQAIGAMLPQTCKSLANRQ